MTEPTRMRRLYPRLISKAKREAEGRRVETAKMLRLCSRTGL